MGCAKEDGEDIFHRLLAEWTRVKSGKMNVQSNQHEVTKNLRNRLNSPRHRCRVSTPQPKTGVARTGKEGRGK